MSFAVENHATGGSHIRLAPGTLINNTYEVVGEAGSGNFARVFECRDVRNNARMAVKLMKPGYERDADFEQEVLSMVNKHDPTDVCGIVRLKEKLQWNSYTGLAFTLKGKALRNSRIPMSRADVMQVGKDVAQSLDFLHFKCRAVHTDLKPENILAEMDPTKPQKWVLCDFGSASFYSAVMDNDLITTRPYRAPEVVMKRGWNYNADTWSLGCILYELCVGRKLFDAQSDMEHLEVMQARLGAIPAHLCPPRTLTGGRRGIRTLKEELSHEPELLAVVEKMLQFDPNSRPKCGDIVSMPYFGGSSTPTTPTTSTAAAPRAALGAVYPASTSNAAANQAYRTNTCHQHSAAPASGAENRGIYASNTGVLRREQIPGSTSASTSALGTRAPQLQAMSQAASNMLPFTQGVSKASFGSSTATGGAGGQSAPLSSSAFRVQNSNYSSASTRSQLPHPSQLPRPTEFASGSAGSLSGGSGSGARGIMSPAMPNYIR